MAVDYLQHSVQLKEAWAPLTVDGPRTWEEYLQSILSGREWGDHYTLTALSAKLKRPIRVISSRGGNPIDINRH